MFVNTVNAVEVKSGKSQRYTVSIQYCYIFIDLFLQLNPVYIYTRSKVNNNESIYNSEAVQLPVVGFQTLEWISIALLDNQKLSSSIDDVRLFLLLLGVVEGLTSHSPPKNSSQLTSCLQILFDITNLLEELFVMWLKYRNTSLGNCSMSSYMSIAYFSRLILRVWLITVNNSSSFFLSHSHISDLQSLLPRPVTMVTNISTNLSKDWLFKENRSFDAEFTFLYLESLYVTMSAISTFVSNSLVPAESFHTALQNSIFDSNQEWFLYICSKLQSVPRVSVQWEIVIDSAHLLLARLTREYVFISDHIHSCQRSAKSQLMQSTDTSLRPANYSLEMSMGFGKLEQRLCKISQSLLSIFDTVPGIQLLALQLLAQTGLDKVGIISDFLPKISHTSVWSIPELLDLYLELLEKAWLQLSSDFSGSSEFWSKISHYVTPLVEGGSQVILQIMYHLLLLYSHRSLYLISSLTEHVILPYHRHIINKFNLKVSSAHTETAPNGKQSLVKVHFEIEEEKVIHHYLKLIQKLSTHPSSLVPFLENQQNLYSLFSFLPIAQFRFEVLIVFDTILNTVCIPWEASILHSNRLSGSKLHYQLINNLLQVAYEFREGALISKCKQLSSAAGRSFVTFDLKQVDEVHVAINSLLEVSTDVTNTLVRSSLIDHLLLINDVWHILANCISTSDELLNVMTYNLVWDVIVILAPTLASLLTRLQLLHKDKQNGVDVEFCLIKFLQLQETCVSLLCHLLSIATVMCRIREGPLKVSCSY